MSKSRIFTMLYMRSFRSTVPYLDINDLWHHVNSSFELSVLWERDREDKDWLKAYSLIYDLLWRGKATWGGLQTWEISVYDIFPTKRLNNMKGITNICEKEPPLPWRTLKARLHCICKTVLSGLWKTLMPAFSSVP